MKAYKYSIVISMRGDPGAIECALDELVASIPTMDLDEVNVTVLNQSEVSDDELPSF